MVTGEIVSEFIEKKSNKLKIFFDKNSLEFKGWETTDAYSNNVSFIIYDLKTNEIIEDEFFKIPKEEDLWFKLMAMKPFYQLFHHQKYENANGIPLVHHHHHY